MLKLIESGDKNTFFERFKIPSTNSYGPHFDFPSGLVIYFNTNTSDIFGIITDIFGTMNSGTYTSGCGCCSTYYDSHDFQDVIYWELYEVTPPAIDLAPTT